MPYRAMIFIRDSSQSPTGKSMGTLVGLWWTSWLFMWPLRTIEKVIAGSGGHSKTIDASWFSIYSSPIPIIAALLAMIVVIRLNTIQRERARELGLTES